MHTSVFNWLCNTAAPQTAGPVLELGSANVNGAARHAWPADTPWTGIDLAPGPGVDIVGTSHNIDAADHTITAVVCVEMLEHDPDPQTTFAEIRRVLAPDGLLILTTRSPGFPHHNPPDHWRYTADDLEHLCVSDLTDADWRPTETLDPIPAPPAARTTPPSHTIEILSCTPDPQDGHPGLMLTARLT